MPVAIPVVASEWLTMSWEFPWPPALGLIICENSGNYLYLPIYSKIIWWMNIQVEEMGGARWGRGGGTVLPCSGCVCCPHRTSIWSAVWKLWIAYFWEFYMGHDGSWTQSPVLPFLKDGRWGWKFPSLNHGFVFLVTSPHPEVIQDPTKSCLIGTKGTLNTQHILRHLGALCQKPGSKTKY